MSAQGTASGAEVLREALKAAGLTQRRLAERIHVDPSRVNRWMTGKATPPADRIRAMETALGCELMSAFQRAQPPYELYLSAPITSIPEESLTRHRSDVGRVADAVREIVPALYWPGETIQSHDDLLAFDRAAKANMKAMDACRGFLYVQFEEMVAPSNCLIELGIALGRRMRTTIIFKAGLRRPSMLEGFTAVAATLHSLPNARMYDVSGPEQASRLIRKNGRSLLGLT